MPLATRVISHLELASTFKLVAITLALDRARCCQEDVFAIAVDVLFPMSEPGHGIVVLNRLPFARNTRDWRLFTLSDIDNNILWTDASLETIR